MVNALVYLVLIFRLLVCQVDTASQSQTWLISPQAGCEHKRTANCEVNVNIACHKLSLPHISYSSCRLLKPHTNCVDTEQ